MTGLMQLTTAFAGGLFGAVVGGFNAFLLCGFLAVVGSVVTLVSGDTAFSTLLPWGPFIGPQAAFTGAVAAAALAARRGKLARGDDLGSALYGMGDPQILLTGGLFGLLGQGLRMGVDRLPTASGIPWVNPIALTIVISGFLVRLIFGKTGLLGHLPPGRSRWHRPADAPWVPWLNRPIPLLLTTAAVSLFSVLIALHLPRSTGLAFGLGAMSLAFFYTGARIPIILHIAWASEYAVLLTGSLVWGLLAGLLAALIAELSAGLFLLHGDTHIDPPSIAVAATFSLGPPMAWLARSERPGWVPWAAVLLLAGVLLVLGEHGQAQTDTDGHGQEKQKRGSVDQDGGGDQLI